ncbi:MAG: ABC transporter ATP-binding protein [Promethearchaeota archaeon]
MGRNAKIKKRYGEQDSDQYKDDIVEKHFKDRELFVRAIGYLKPYKWQFSVILIIVVINAFIRVYPVTLLQQAIDEAQKFSRDATHNPSKLYYIGLQLILFYALNYFTSTANQYYMGYISQHTIFDLRQETFIKLQNLSFSYYDKRKAGKIMSRVMNDVEAINLLMTNGFPKLLGDSISLVYIVILLIQYSWVQTVVTVLIGPAIFFFARIIGRIARRYYRKSRKTIAEVYTKLEQGVSGMKTIKAFTREEESMKEFEGANRANMEVNIQAGKIMASIGPIFQTIAFSVLALVFVIAFYDPNLRDESGTFQLGKFIAIVLLILQLYSPISQLAGFYNQIQSALAAAERIFSVLDHDIEVKEKPGSISDHVIEGKVEFKNVYFHYEEGVPVLKNISFTVNPKETLAIVGYTGAGKTTLINLLCRFYDVIDGEILIDGINIKDYNLKSLRSQLGIVLQHPFLFTDTVIENIRYGSDASDEEVIEVAKRIGAHDFIMDLEKGYDTGVRERGVILSQGQRQLISFARALMANPRILILDEATSALDSYSEMLLQNAIEEITRDRTSFVIAHRLSTIRNADKIIVLEKGEIVEMGTHEELIELGGLYAKLYKLQFRDLELLEEDELVKGAAD